MKKVLTIALTGVLAAAALAVESDPSNTVGFISQTVPSNSYSTISMCPTGLSVVANAADYIGGQGLPGDIAYTFTTGWTPYPHSADGTFTNMTFDYNSFVLYQNAQAVDQTIVVAGDVIAEGTDLNLATFAAGVNGWGNPLPMDIDLDVDDLNLSSSGIASDDILYAFTTGWVPYNYDGTYGGLVLEAGESYLFSTAGAVDWNWMVGGAPAADAARPAKVARKTAAASSLN